MKRTRERETRRRETRDCVVCMESMQQRGPRTEIHPFQCAHSICRTCDANMARRDLNRCPTCRTPRRGMSASEAEPIPDPALDEPLPVFHGILGHGYPSRNRPRPRVVFFPRQPPVDAAGNELRDAAGGELREVVADALAVAAARNVAMGANTLSILTHVLPAEILQALVDPTSGISGWHEARRRWISTRPQLSN